MLYQILVIIWLDIFHYLGRGEESEQKTRSYGLSKSWSSLSFVTKTKKERRHIADYLPVLGEVSQNCVCTS
jgi:hypothetical protein